jgi:hypothetical protein
MADPTFWTKPQLAAALIEQARGAGVPFRAIVVDCFYGDHFGFVEALERAGLPYVLALKPNKCGSSRATSRSKGPWAGPTSGFGAIPRFRAIGSWSAAPSLSAGGHGSAHLERSATGSGPSPKPTRQDCQRLPWLR